MDDVADFNTESVNATLHELFNYFGRTWIRKYPPDERSKSFDVSIRSNNWSNAFNSSFSRRFVRGIRTSASSSRSDALRKHDVRHVERVKNRPRPKKQDHFADELVADMEMMEMMLSDDTLCFVDVLSRIPSHHAQV